MPDGGCPTRACESPTACVTDTPDAVLAPSRSAVARHTDPGRYQLERLSTRQPSEVHAAMTARRVKYGNDHVSDVASCSSVRKRELLRSRRLLYNSRSAPS